MNLGSLPLWSGMLHIETNGKHLEPLEERSKTPTKMRVGSRSPSAVLQCRACSLCSHCSTGLWSFNINSTFFYSNHSGEEP